MKIRQDNQSLTRRKKTERNKKIQNPKKGKEEEKVIYKLLTTTPLLPHFLRDS
jgi:hypothetical protein